MYLEGEAVDTEEDVVFSCVEEAVEPEIAELF